MRCPPDEANDTPDERRDGPGTRLTFAPRTACGLTESRKLCMLFPSSIVMPMAPARSPVRVQDPPGGAPRFAQAPGCGTTCHSPSSRYCLLGRGLLGCAEALLPLALTHLPHILLLESENEHFFSVKQPLSYSLFPAEARVNSKMRFFPSASNIKHPQVAAEAFLFSSSTSIDT